MPDSEQRTAREELRQIKELVSNPYYQNDVKPSLDIKSCLDAFVNLDVVDVATFFQREQVIGELRTYVRIRQLIEDRIPVLEDQIKQEDEQEGQIT